MEIFFINIVLEKYTFLKKTFHDLNIENFIENYHLLLELPIQILQFQIPVSISSVSTKLYNHKKIKFCEFHVNLRENFFNKK